MHTYMVEVVRDGRWWMVHVPEIDDFTQARRIGEIELMARELIALNTNTPLADVRVTVGSIAVGEDDAAASALYVRGLREHATELEERSLREARSFARRLTTAGVPVRDIAELLHVSPQRISQLANAATD